jgi:hypothetical protein
MGKTDWDIVTSYADAVTTTLKTVTFPKVQESVYLRNQGNANFSYTIGSQSGTLTPGQSVTVNQDVSSFTLQAVSGTHTFEVRAKEKGTEQTEDNSSDVMSLLADLVDDSSYGNSYVRAGIDLWSFNPIDPVSIGTADTTVASSTIWGYITIFNTTAAAITVTLKTNFVTFAVLSVPANGVTAIPNPIYCNGSLKANASAVGCYLTIGGQT